MKVFLIFLLITATQGAFAIESINVSGPAKAAEATNEIKVGVKGMVCAFCAQGIEKTFMAQKEVASIQISLADKFVKIKFKEGQKLSNEKIAELLKESGYEAVFGG